MSKSTPVFVGGKKAPSTYFQKSGILTGKRQTQRPFLAFRRNDNGVNVEVIEDINELVKLPAKTRVMTQWEGKNRSDYVNFTVGDLRKYYQAANAAE